jgi:hypothetical protein
MKVNGNVAIHFGDVPSPRDKEEMKENGQSPTKNIYAGNLNLTNHNMTQGDTIAEKREEARKRAMQVVKDAYHNDLQVDNDIENNCDKADELRKSIAETYQNIKEIDELTEQAGQMEDGEAKDEMLSNLEEYRKEYVEQMNDDEKEKAKAVATVKGMKLERLKYHEMADAQEQADDILESASKEIMGMLMEEGKDFMDEAQEEQEEKAEKLAEKQEEMEQFIEDAEEKREEREEMMELTKNAVTMEQVQEDVKTEIANIVDKMKLVAEDIKGTTVDKQI